jgi:hypothetical protein
MVVPLSGPFPGRFRVHDPAPCVAACAPFYYGGDADAMIAVLIVEFAIGLAVF